ncbi:UNVERIFIED_CONTAM: Glucan endo-1,3-beta-glucosidase 9 [Sesamum latifolium]|uniref:Glucan endo-1,3-beta-glucosidase 9 n=1 Tax=Sesamum latifolium TaxID=2727402 RepID=A0AAW2XZA3_9LAMI
MASQSLKSTPIFQLLSLSLIISLSAVAEVEGLGVNWGTAASHPLPPQKVVELLKANNIGKVKLFDADPLVLQSLSGSNIHVTVGVPNSMLRSLNSSLKAAESWVHDNLTRFVSDGASRVLIDYVAVGDEPFLQSYGEQFYPFVVGAAANIQMALFKANLAGKVKVVAPCSFDAFLSESRLPSKARFRPDVNRTMIELLTFLNRHHSPFFVTISPFQSYHENKNFSLDFALFREAAHARNDSHKTYKNGFDLSYDTIISALSTAGFPQVDVVIGRIDWPTDGAPNATSSLAQEFMKGLIDHLHSRSTKSSKRQDLPTEIYILSLLDEDKRSIATGNFERHWACSLLTAKLSIKLISARVQENWWMHKTFNTFLPNAVSPGGSCFNLSWPGNISYAFNSYYQQHDQNPENCDFAGLGLITTVDPSVDGCRRESAV